VNLYELNTTSSFNESYLCLTIGNFDGIHKGHQILINRLLEESKDLKLKTAVLSFTPHPKKYFGYTSENFNIITQEEKLNFLKKMGLDIFIDFKFNENLANLNAEDFIKDIIIKKLNVKKIIVGSDFRFGKNRLGNINTLKKLSKILNFQLIEINILNLNNTKEKFSSSYVRKTITEGNFKRVSQMLGRNWTLSGKIIKGDQKARKINFPTANIKPLKKIFPKMGVYIVNAIFDKKKYKGIANFGYRPTVDGSTLLLETHIFNFNKDIYGKELTIEFLEFIRSEKKFNSFDELTKQIIKDISVARKYHKI
tara:strand:+ start:1608 stop:2537 length:930 start_codon:yes stop_codon:yes gene_type:complete